MKKSKTVKILTALFLLVSILNFAACSSDSGSDDSVNSDISGEQAVGQSGTTVKLINKLTCLNEDGKITSYRHFSYNEKGLMYQENIYDGHGNYSGKIIYEHDEAGHFIKCENFNYNGVSINSTEVEYDEFGNQKTHDEFGYDSNNNIIAKKDYYDDGTLEKLEEYEYDVNGNIVVKKDYVYPENYVEGNDPKRAIISEYKYSQDGKLIEKTEHSEMSGYSGGERTVYKYDDNGKIIEKMIYSCYSDGDIENERCDYTMILQVI